MAQYSEAEIREFRAKDKRISRQAVLKELINKLELEKIYEVNEVCKLCESYVDYVYNGVSEIVIDWVEIAKGLSLEVPTKANIMILDLVLNQYKTKYNTSVNPAHILNHIFTCFGRYPTSQESVKVVLKSLNESKV